MTLTLPSVQDRVQNICRRLALRLFDDIVTPLYVVISEVQSGFDDGFGVERLDTGFQGRGVDLFPRFERREGVAVQEVGEDGVEVQSRAHRGENLEWGLCEHDGRVRSTCGPS